ncbi:MAG: hypothetical protein ABI597_03170 [Gammaproteobacteria bacterium]
MNDKSLAKTRFAYYANAISDVCAATLMQAWVNVAVPELQQGQWRLILP